MILTAPNDLGGLRKLSAIISQRLNNTEPALACSVFAPAENVLEQNIECVRDRARKLRLPSAKCFAAPTLPAPSRRRLTSMRGVLPSQRPRSCLVSVVQRDFFSRLERDEFVILDAAAWMKARRNFGANRTDRHSMRRRAREQSSVQEKLRGRLIERPGEKSRAFVFCTFPQAEGPNSLKMSFLAATRCR